MKDKLAAHATELSDVQLLTVIAVHRIPYWFEFWSSEGVIATKMALRNMKEYHDANGIEPETLHPTLDLVIPADPTLIERAYTVALQRSPTAEELALHSGDGRTSMALLSAKLLYPYESFKVDGLVEQVDEDRFHNLRQTSICFQQHDLYCRAVIKGKASSRFANKRMLNGPRRDVLSVRNNMFGLTLSDRDFVTAEIFEDCGVTVQIEPISADEIIAGKLDDDIDILLTNNNFLQDRAAELRPAIRDSRALSGCWLWDNHHTFGDSIGIAEHTDVVFPSHTNEMNYLYGCRAIVGPVVPACTIQFPGDYLAKIFRERRDLVASDELYGRFNIHYGRAALRNVFIKRINEEFSTQVQSHQSQFNPWFGLDLEQKIMELAGHKAILCLPLYNDVSTRVFDAIAVGSIAVVPYGLRDLPISFPVRAAEDSPIVQYEPDNLESLRHATKVAVRRYDKGGFAGRLARHESIFKSHRLRNRMRTLILEMIKLRDILA